MQYSDYPNFLPPSAAVPAYLHVPHSQGIQISPFAWVAAKFTFSWVVILLRRLSPLHFHGLDHRLPGSFYRREAHPAPLQLYCTDTSYRIPPSKTHFLSEIPASDCCRLFPFSAHSSIFQYIFRQHHSPNSPYPRPFWRAASSLLPVGNDGNLKRSPIDRRNRQTDAVNRDRSFSRSGASISFGASTVTHRVSFPLHIRDDSRTVDMARSQCALQTAVRSWRVPGLLRHPVSVSPDWSGASRLSHDIRRKGASFMLVTVRRTPLTAILSPILLPSSTVDAPITICPHSAPDMTFFHISPLLL